MTEWMRDTGCGISRLILCTAAIIQLITLRPVPAPIYHIGTPSVQTISNNIQLFSSPSTKLTKPETAILSSVSVWSGAVSQGVASRGPPQGYPPPGLMQKCRWQVLCCQWWTRGTWHTWQTLTRQTRDTTRRRRDCGKTL